MTTTAPAEIDTRTAYTAGLRALADLLDSHPDVPLPYTGTGSPLLWILAHDTDQKATLQRLARLFDGPVDKHHRDEYFDLHGALAGLKLHVIADRDSVCERVVTGTREVTTEVPDPDALASVPTTTVTTTVEDVEWICRPLLANDPVPA